MAKSLCKPPFPKRGITHSY